MWDVNDLGQPALLTDLAGGHLGQPVPFRAGPFFISRRDKV